ncbi:hypothetical protein [Thermocrispum agreste]|jgi:hypothetical protein|uniref:hypothetical protein n=1 Tax=Thermocrispum agreste TaxID=37925 RepID=UPI00041E8A6A
MTVSPIQGQHAPTDDHSTPFSRELRAAIKASGLGLDRIQVRLRNRGIPISVTALSYWQSGKRQPERARSISAVRALEEILGRPAGSLVRLLEPPRPRGRAARNAQARRTTSRQPERTASPPQAKSFGGLVTP